jgi:hypothetical protein
MVPPMSNSSSFASTTCSNASFEPRSPDLLLTVDLFDTAIASPEHRVVVAGFDGERFSGVAVTTTNLRELPDLRGRRAVYGNEIV